MARYHRFEDALPAWREKARLTTRAGPEPAGLAGRSYDRIGQTCLSWMVEQGCWPNQAADMPRVEAEVLSALRQLSDRGAEPDAPGVAASAWAVPAAGGAALGALLVSPLTWIWLDNRAIGLFLGGTLGAYLAVRGIATLLERPGLVSAIRSAATLSGGGMVVGGVWRAIRGQAIGVFRSALWLAAVPLLLTVLQRQLTTLRAAPSEGRQPDAAADLAHVADLALAVCWAHPDRLPARLDVVRPKSDALTHPVWVAISRLRTEWERGKPHKELAAACEELFQRFEEDGYEWRFVPRGHRYAEEMAETFDSFGTIGPGQLVRTHRAAITRQGQLVFKGEIRRA